MKTIKIFLASSEELDYDRMAFGNLVRRLDDMYEKRGIRIKLFEWEDCDSAYNDKRKQDEYNDYVRQSDIFLALFHKKAGGFTVEEFNIATEEFKEKASPKVYTYCKDLKPEEEETPELKEFKKRLFDEMGHYWCRYDNRESLQFQFVMQLQLVESNQMDDVKVEDGIVTINGLPVAKMENLKFAVANEDFLRMREELNTLPAKIEKSRIRLKKYPDDDDLIEDLQQKLNKYNKLKKDFAKHQELLFDTAKRVAQIDGEYVTDRLRRAIEALNEGKVHEANIILNEAEEDARQSLNNYKQSKEITEQKRKNVIKSIEVLLVKAASIMADESIEIDSRIETSDAIYKQAIQTSKEIDNYDKVKYLKMLFSYAHFLEQNAFYPKAIKITKETVMLCKESYGERHLQTASAYNLLGNLYSYQYDDINALNYYNKALTIREEIMGSYHPDIASIYNNIGLLLTGECNYSQALECYQKALAIYDKNYGSNNHHLAILYNNISDVYSLQGNYELALEYCKKALSIRNSLYGEKHPSLADSYNSMSYILSHQRKYEQSLDYSMKAKTICEKYYGKIHPVTADSYTNIGNIYIDCKNYDKAKQYHITALDISIKVFGKDHPDVARAYTNIGNVYSLQQNDTKALKCYQEALNISNSVFNGHHFSIAMLNNNIGLIHLKNNKLQMAEECFTKSLSLYIDIYGESHPYVADLLYNLAHLYTKQENYASALEKFELYLKFLKEYNNPKERIKETEEKIVALKELMKNGEGAES